MYEPELWREIPGLESRYAVSNKGRVYSLPRVVPNKHGTQSPIKGKILIPSIVKGYPKLSVIFNNKRKHFTIHRLVAKLFIPNPDNKPQVNHIDGNKLNNDASNLEWCTAIENIAHAVKSGLRVARKGEDVNFSKLNKLQVMEIRNTYDGRLTYFASKYNVCNMTINNIINRKTWRSI